MRPTVAIVGRPNVGKSSLFNRLVGQPIAIVDPTPGTTRDRLLHEVRRDGVRFDLIDTGGIGIVDEAKLEADVHRQIERAIATADRILFLVDARDGVAHLDREIAERLRPIRERVILIANKVDHEGLEGDIHVFAKLGLGTPHALSAAQATGIHALMELLCASLPAMREGSEAAEADGDDDRIRLALVGRRNVGKSSLTNAICGEERVIVADLPGTTRDAIDVEIDRPEGRFTLIDTAGLRKRAKVDGDLEFYSACRTERAIKRAQVVLFVLDASDDLGMMDKKIAHFCESEGKPVIIVLNKWDLAEAGGAKRAQYIEWLHDRLPGLAYAPVVTTCALSGFNLDDILTRSVEMVAETRSRVATSELNRLIELAVERRRPRKVGPQPTRIYYATQAETQPPTFIVFVNRTDWIEPGYSRFLEGFLRERLPFKQVPLRILFKSRDSRLHENQDAHRVIRGRNRADRSPTLVVPPSARTRNRIYHRDEKPDPVADEPDVGGELAGTPGAPAESPKPARPRGRPGAKGGAARKFLADSKRRGGKGGHGGGFRR